MIEVLVPVAQGAGRIIFVERILSGHRFVRVTVHALPVPALIPLDEFGRDVVVVTGDSHRLGVRGDAGQLLRHLLSPFVGLSFNLPLIMPPFSTLRKKIVIRFFKELREKWNRPKINLS